LSKKITYRLWLPKWFPNKVSSTDGVFVLEHARALKSMTSDHLVVLFCMAAGNSFTTEEETVDDIYIVRVYYPESKNGIDKLLAINRFQKAQQLGFDLIKEKFGYPLLTHVHIFGRQALLAKRLKKKHHIPFFITSHWTGFLSAVGKKIPWLKKTAYRRIAKNSNGGSSVSRELLKSVKGTLQLPLEEWKVIPNVISPEFSMKNREKGEILNIVHISTLKEEHKRFGTILNTFIRIAKTNSLIHMNVFGGTKEREKFYLDQVPMDLRDQIHFGGILSKEELASVLQKMHFGVFYSKYETQCLGILECLASGLPCIVPNLPAINEYFNPSLGIKIDSDPGALHRAFITMLENYDEYAKKVKHDFKRDQFSQRKVGSAFLELYQSNY